MFLKIANQSYEVAEATLFAYVICSECAISTPIIVTLGEIFWSLEIDIGVGMSFWHHEMQLPNLQRWTDLVGQRVTTESPLNPITGEWDCGWYGAGILTGNSEILESNLHFVDRSKCQLHVQWCGIASTAPLNCEPDADEKLDFEIDCWCTFLGIGVLNANKHDELAKRELITKFLEIEGFSQSFVETGKFVPGHLPMLKPLC